MNNPLNSNEFPRSKSLPGVRTTVALRHDGEKGGLLGSDKPRVLHMSATLRRMLNEVDAAQNSVEDEIARA